MSDNAWMRNPFTLGLRNRTVANDESTTEQFSIELAEFVAANFFLGLFSFVGLAVNCAVIAAILSNKVLRDIPSNLFVLSLAIADAFLCLIYSAICLHMARSKLLTETLRFTRYIVHLTRLALLSGSSNLLLLIYNRFISIYDPFNYLERMTLKRAKLLIFVVWSLAVVLACLSAVSSFVVYLTVIHLAVCELATTAINVYLLKQASDQRKAIARLHKSVLTGQKRSVMREYRSFLRLTVVICTSTLANVYNVVSWFYRSAYLSRKSRTYQIQAIVCFIVLALIAAIHPLVYSITSEEFKRIVKKVKDRLFQRCYEKYFWPAGSRRNYTPPFLVRRQIRPAENH